jgi:hypothetical protein
MHIWFSIIIHLQSSAAAATTTEENNNASDNRSANHLPPKIET